jgi:hypothetical protein
MSPAVDLSRYSSIIPKEHIHSLSICFRKIPDFSWLLTSPHSELERLQGDLISSFPTAYVDSSGNARTAKFTVMILNNSCDLPDERLDFVTVAPVMDFGAYLEGEKRRRSAESLKGHATAIRNNDITEILYLPSIGPFRDGAIVLLHLVCSVSVTVYKNAIREGCRIASFTQNGFYFLLVKLTTHIARPESREVVRVQEV